MEAHPVGNKHYGVQSVIFIELQYFYKSISTPFFPQTSKKLITAIYMEECILLHLFYVHITYVSTCLTYDAWIFKSCLSLNSCKEIQIFKR